MGSESSAEIARVDFQKIRGREISMIFQDPMTSLNPCFTIEYQLLETLESHQIGEKSQRKEMIVKLLEAVGISDPATRLQQYPYELSGGMAQRVMMAMAICCSPDLLIADEPTTALDVDHSRSDFETAAENSPAEKNGMILVSHDMGVIAEKYR